VIIDFNHWTDDRYTVVRKWLAVVVRVDAMGTRQLSERMTHAREPIAGLARHFFKL